MNPWSQRDYKMGNAGSRWILSRIPQYLLLVGMLNGKILAEILCASQVGVNLNQKLSGF